MFIDKSEVRCQEGRFDHLSDEELVRLVKDEADALLIEHQAKAVDVVPKDDGTD
jgi:hypothetical protein